MAKSEPVNPDLEAILEAVKRLSLDDCKRLGWMLGEELPADKLRALHAAEFNGSQCRSEEIAKGEKSPLLTDGQSLLLEAINLTQARCFQLVREKKKRRPPPPKPRTQTEEVRRVVGGWYLAEGCPPLTMKKWTVYANKLKAAHSDLAVKSKAPNKGKPHDGNSLRALCGNHLAKLRNGRLMSFDDQDR